MSLNKTTKKRPIVYSRHPSHVKLREHLPHFNKSVIIRLGSTNPGINSDQKIQINTVQAIKNSSDKLLMKECFTSSGIKTADWWTHDQYAIDHINELPYPVIAKHRFGSRGTGNHLLNTKEELELFITNKTLNNYIFEKYYTYNREYRLHVTKNGCFYTCRKMIKRDCPDDKKFQRHDDNCVWVVEDNPLFDKPVNWNSIVEDCIRALNSVGLDIGAFDIKVQSAKNKEGILRKDPEYIIIESNSAPSFGEITHKMYLKELTNLIIDKHEY